MAIASFAELIEHEAEVLERIASIPNGEQLFLIHPLMLLADAGVMLSEEAHAELLEREPGLSTLSSVPYLELRACQEPQTVRYHLDGLFCKGAQ